MSHVRFAVSRCVCAGSSDFGAHCDTAAHVSTSRARLASLTRAALVALRGKAEPMRRAALPPGWRAAPYHTRAVLHAIEWRRLVFDECHEAILLDNHKHMANFMRLRARNVWCVSGTPFVQNDVSMYGIHNLLGIRLKLHVSDTPFASVQSLQARHALMHAHASVPRTPSVCPQRACQQQLALGRQCTRSTLSRGGRRFHAHTLSKF
jgi:hypothetical protein